MIVPKVTKPVSSKGRIVPGAKIHVLHPTTQRGKAKSRSGLWFPNRNHNRKVSRYNSLRAGPWAEGVTASAVNTALLQRWGLRLRAVVTPSPQLSLEVTGCALSFSRGS